MFASCLEYTTWLFCKCNEIVSWMIKSPRAVAKGKWSSMLNMVSTDKICMLKVLHNWFLKEDLFIHSKTQVTVYIQSFNWITRPFLKHLTNWVLLASINYYKILEGMTSTMMKLKMKMEKEEKEECEDAQAPKSRKH